MSANTTIYVGFWNNYAKGAVLGSTLTLSKSNGAVLIAALAIFLQLAGGQSWTIICFLTHQLRATTNARDGLYHQQQATLRNNTADISTTLQLMKIGWAWRSRSSGFKRSLTLITIGAIHILGFGAASILSSHITTVGNQVLIAQSSTCGYWGPNANEDQSGSALSSAYPAYIRDSMETSQQYVSNCLGETQSLPECNIFNRLQFNWTSASSPCPFDGMCLGPTDTGALYMDTGWIDSRDDLGINGQDKDRIQFRKVAECVPIMTEGYISNGTSTLEYTKNPNSVLGDGTPTGQAIFNYTAAFYGPQRNNLTQVGIMDPALQNSTYIYTNFRDVATNFWNYEQSPYDVHIEIADGGGFTPVAPLAGSNRTLSLIFASFYGTYTAPSDDLWLAAHQNLTTVVAVDGVNGGAHEEYGPDSAISVLACTEKFRICNPSPNDNITSPCTPWISTTQIDEIDGSTLEMMLNNDHQLETVNSVAFAAVHSIFYFVIFMLSSPLLAGNLASGTESFPPASDQWILEAKNWFTISLANTQRLLTDYITGPPPQFEQYAIQNQAANNSALAWLCGHQIIRRDDFTNFSTLAIGLVFGLGGVIIGTSLCLETITGWVRARRKKGLWRQRIWWSEGALQLQRGAYEALGVKDWELGEWNRVPITSKGQVWSVLQNLDDKMLPVVEGRKVSVGGGEEKKTFMTASVSAVLSHNEGSREFGRVRSNSW